MKKRKVRNWIIAAIDFGHFLCGLVMSLPAKATRPTNKTKGEIKIVLKDATGRTIGSDVSDGFFTIKLNPPN